MTAAAASKPKQDDVAFQAGLYADPNPTRRALHNARKDWIEAQLAAFARPRDRALEVGVGCGVFTRMLAARVETVTAVDINPKFLDALAGEPAITTRLADATEPFAHADHDLAVCSEVLEHVPRSRSVAMLRALHGALKPGGKLILTTPQRYASVELFARLLTLPPVLAIARRIYGHAEPLGHVNLLTHRALLGQIAQAGFLIEKKALLGFYLPVIAEFGGVPGQRVLSAMERVVARLPLLRELVWTQGFVLSKPALMDGPPT